MFSSPTPFETIVNANSATIDGSDSEKTVLVLVGLIGSGKSTFAKALEKYNPNFRRANQDDLGGRQQVEYVTRSSLRDGLSVCIDRTNFDESQRSRWYKMARQYNAKVYVLVFNTSKEECLERLRTRENHPTIKDFEMGRNVLERFSNDYRHVEAHEDYDRLLVLETASQLPEYTDIQLANILQQIRESPRA